MKGIMKSAMMFYQKLSSFGKLLVVLGIFMVVMMVFKSLRTNFLQEGMTNTKSLTKDFLFKDGTAAYDDFYADIYDHLVYSFVKNDYEVGTIINATNPVSTSVIADIGSGTGHHVGQLAAKNLQVIGVDISPSMIKKAKENYPQLQFKVGDALDNGLFKPNSLTHVLCLYFTIYYMKDKRAFFQNAYNWLMPGGYLVVHLVDREHFDPILPPGNPLYIVSPQKYAKERITKTKVTFNDFVYNANFDLDPSRDVAVFHEKFKFNDGGVRKQEQTLYMEDTSAIANMASEVGFSLEGKIDMTKAAYEHQYLYIFIRPE